VKIKGEKKTQAIKNKRISSRPEEFPRITTAANQSGAGCNDALSDSSEHGRNYPVDYSMRAAKYGDCALVSSTLTSKEFNLLLCVQSLDSSQLSFAS
jgi:hypothetical protein